MVEIVLLIALTNVAMLLMAQRSTAARVQHQALGAGRGDLLRQLLTKSILLVVNSISQALSVTTLLLSYFGNLIDSVPRRASPGVSLLRNTYR
ncbi:MAG TPA: hypothetical protein VGF44_03350 [Terriglobales bacterium]|jgi:hypothetical protein